MTPDERITELEHRVRRLRAALSLERSRNEHLRASLDDEHRQHEHAQKNLDRLDETHGAFITYLDEIKPDWRDELLPRLSTP